jgi:hypothetical protein
MAALLTHPALEISSTAHWLGDSVGSGVGLEVMKTKLYPHRDLNPSSTISQLVHWSHIA